MIFKPRSLFNRILSGLVVTAMICGGIFTTPLLAATPATINSTPAASKAAPASALERVNTGSENTTLKADGNAVDPLANATGPTPVMIELLEEPAVTTYIQARNAGLSSVEQTQNSVNQRAIVSTAQQAVLASASSANLNLQVHYQVRDAYNGIAGVVEGKNIARLRALPGVKAVHPLPMHERDNSGGIPFIGAPAVWSSYGITGTNLKIGIIDTGIDYLHTNFGGPGTYSGYDDTVITDTVGIFPGPKVAGGYDFSGNAYTGGATPPQPDPDPLDCASSLGGGHGSHVAGTAAGYGVNADGTTFTGPYDENVPFNTMRIGPGVAPGAKLYALRVFGCTGSTGLTVQAIDWATTGGTGDFANRLDIINMSLGSPYGSPEDPSAAASNNASALGILVVVSAGNSNDVHYVSGSPGSAVSALTVANIVDPVDQTDGYRVNSPGSIAGVYGASRSANYNWSSPPAANPVPVTATVAFLSTNPSGCTAYSASEIAAATGKIVLVEWAPAGQTGAGTFPCGSAARANNAANAGAKGIIMASGVPYLDTAISGNATIPAMFTTYTNGQLIKNALTSGPVEVTLTTEYFGKVRLNDPAAGDLVNSSSSRGPQGRGNLLKPDISAPGTGIFSTDSGTGNQGTSKSGTSMAAPHMSGVMALLREKNSTWSVAELKALAMNTAVHDLFRLPGQTGTKYGPARVGSGRVDVPAAIANTVVAYNTAQAEAVSVSFGLVEVVSSTTLTRSITISNKGTSTASFTLSYDTRTDLPGVEVTFPGGSTVSVAAGATATVQVQLSVPNALDLQNLRDATVTASQGGNPRHYLSEESGLILLTPVSGPALRVPVYAIVRAASDMKATNPMLILPTATVTSSITLSGTGFSNSSTPTFTTSLVTPMELQGISASQPVTPSLKGSDLQYIGVSTDSRARLAASQLITSSTIYFGITTHGNWTTPASEVQFSIYIDRDLNGTDDLQLFNTRFTDSDVFVTALAVLPSTSGSVQGFANVFNSNITTYPLNNNVLIMPVNAAALGMGSNTKFRYRVEAFNRFYGTIDAEGPFTFDYANPGFDFNNNATGVAMFKDVPGSFPLTANLANYKANGSQGVLLMHHNNTTGNRAEVIKPFFCNQVNQPTDNGLGQDCGTLSFALSQDVVPSASVAVDFQVSGNTITFSGPLTYTVKPGVTLNGGACDTNPPTKIVGAGGTGLQLLGGTQLKNLWIGGFGDRQIVATNAGGKGANKLICVRATKAPPS